MNDDQLARLLRQVDEPASPDPAFADRLFDQLTRTASRPQGTRPALLLVAALTLMAALAVGAAVAGGLLKVSWLTLEVTPTPRLQALLSAQASPSPAASGQEATPSRSASGQPSASPPPTSSTAVFNLLPAHEPAGFTSKIACNGSIGPGDPVAIVQVHGAVGSPPKEVLRDYADVGSPRTACTFGLTASTSVLTLIDARHVVIADAEPIGYTYAVVDLPEVHYHWFQLPGDTKSLRTYIAVGPAMDHLLWMSADVAGGTDQIHVTTAIGDEVVGALPNPHAGRCGIPEEDSTIGGYTHSGDDFFVLDQPIPNLNSLLIGSGQAEVLSVRPPAAGWSRMSEPAMALWSPTSETLYYRQGSDIWTWMPGSNPKRFLAGVSWQHPTITPDGAHLAYSVRRPDGLHDVYLVDLAHGGSPRLIGQGRALPAFLNSTQLWYKTDVALGCTGPASNEPLIYNLADGSEAPSVIDFVYGAWPATSSAW